MNNLDFKSLINFISDTIEEFNSSEMWNAHKYGNGELIKFDRKLYARLEQIYDILIEEISLCTASNDINMSDCEYKTKDGKCAICQRGFSCEHIKHFA